MNDPEISRVHEATTSRVQDDTHLIWQWVTLCYLIALGKSAMTIAQFA